MSLFWNLIWWKLSNVRNFTWNSSSMFFFFFFYLKVWFHITRFSKNWVFHWNSIFRKSSLKQGYFARYFQNKCILLESFSEMDKCPFWPQISLRPIQSGVSTRTRRHKQFRNQAASVENSQASFLSKSQKC